MNETFYIPSDINQNKTIFSPLDEVPSLNIAIYADIGAGEDGIQNIKKNIADTLHIKVQELTANDIRNNDLSAYDAIIFSGGSGSKQAEALGEEGKRNIKHFIEHGGGYLGICAGAYLASSGFDWSLHLVPVKTISVTEWKRGKGFVDLELTQEGRDVFGPVDGLFKCRYSSGPLLQPLDSSSHFNVLAYFRSEVSDNGVTEGVMRNTPAVLSATYGKVLLISTHPENTPGLEHMISRGLKWLREKK